jgi:hypothetical protein
MTETNPTFSIKEINRLLEAMWLVQRQRDISFGDFNANCQVVSKLHELRSNKLGAFLCDL